MFNNKKSLNFTGIFLALTFVFLTGCGKSVPIKKMTTFNLSVKSVGLLEGKAVQIQGHVDGLVESLDESMQVSVDNFFIGHLTPIIRDLLTKVGASSDSENTDYQFSYKLIRLADTRIINSEYNISDNKLRLIPITGHFVDRKYRAIANVKVLFELKKADEVIKSKEYLIDQFEMVVEVDNGRLEAKQVSLELYEKEQMKILKDFFDNL